VFGSIDSILLLICGLGITRLLSDIVAAFRARDKLHLHWIPILWTVLVFMFQMQFVWAVLELESVVKVWTVWRFLLLLIMSLLLFVAGTLIVPRASGGEPREAWDQFMQDGRWSVAFMACYTFLAFLINPVLFGIPLLLHANLLHLFLAVILALLLLTRKQNIWAWGTIVFTVIMVIAMVVATPSEYK